MATYLLLRNNKESGPLSFDEVIKSGLKPYDLVWVNGKSAAWRYPSEIPELIPYSPVVEEQPTNRSFQKTNEPVKEANTEQTLPGRPTEFPPQQTEPPHLQPANGNHHQHKMDGSINKHSKVFVSLPEKKEISNPVAPVEDQSKFIPFNSYDQRFIRQEEARNSLPDANRFNVTNKPVAKNITETPVELEEKFSQPLDEIKEMYVQTLNQRKKRNARKQVLSNGLKLVAAVSIILAIGMLIGMYYEQDSEKKEVVDNVVPDEPKPVELSSTSFVSSSKTGNIEPVNEHVPVQENDDDFTKIYDEGKENRMASNVKSKNGKTKPVPYSGVVVDSQTNERKRVIRDDDSALADTDISPVKKGSIENIWEDVTLMTSDFKTGPFGGIKDLQITLANKSAYPLDKVEIEVKYIGLEKQVVKTQRMVFNDVLPGGQVHADVPKTGRGMDVDVSIKKINVKDFSFARTEN